MQVQQQGGSPRGGPRVRAGRRAVGARQNMATPFLTQVAIDRVEQWRTTPVVGFNTALNRLLAAWRESEPQPDHAPGHEALHGEDAPPLGNEAAQVRPTGIKKSVALWAENLSWVGDRRWEQERLGQTLSRLIEAIPITFVPPEPEQKGPHGGHRRDAGRPLGGGAPLGNKQKSFTIAEYAIERVQERLLPGEKFSVAVRRILESLVVPADFDSGSDRPDIAHGRRRRKCLSLSQQAWELVTRYRHEGDGNSRVLSRLLEMLPPQNTSPQEDGAV